MMTIQPGEFWVADIVFTNGIASKKRPVLILWLDAMMLLSQWSHQPSPERQPIFVSMIGQPAVYVWLPQYAYLG